jgi:hypothetical protein
VPTTWYNLLTKMGLYGEGNPRSDVVGIGVFLRQADAPDVPSEAMPQTDESMAPCCLNCAFLQVGQAPRAEGRRTA